MPADVMSANEIALSVENAVLKSQSILRDEHQKGIAAVHTEVGAVKDDIAGVKAQVGLIQADVNLLKNGQGDMQQTLKRVDDSLKALGTQLSDISTETHEVKTETADGVTFTKKVRMYATVFGDLKKPITWVWGVITLLAYNFSKAWLVAHGITFTALFSRN